MRTLDLAEVNILLEAAERSHYYPVIYTALSTGLRQAELLGFSWRNIELGVIPSISVSRVLYKRKGVCEFREPKTSRSRRLVSMTPPLAEFLREYRRDRKALYHELGKELALDDLVFANVEGKPIDPGVLSHNFARLVKRAGLENVRFHDLRHTFASLALRQGIHPKTVSEALGHASVGFTMDTYSHIIQGMQAEAMVRLGDILPQGRLLRNSFANSSPPVDIMLLAN
jgi:integrase